MFQKNSVSIIYRLLCLISYIIVILLINSTKTILLLTIAYAIFAIFFKCFRFIEFIIITIVILIMCYLLNNYVLLRVMIIIDYISYYLDVSSYSVEKEIKINKKDYIRFKKEKKKESNNSLALYLTVHLVLLFLAILVG